MKNICWPWVTPSRNQKENLKLTTLYKPWQEGDSLLLTEDCLLFCAMRQLSVGVEYRQIGCILLGELYGNLGQILWVLGHQQWTSLKHKFPILGSSSCTLILHSALILYLIGMDRENRWLPDWMHSILAPFCTVNSVFLPTDQQKGTL